MLAMPMRAPRHPRPPPTADTDSRMQREERCAGRVVHLHENFITQP